MKGIVFTEFLEMLEAQHSADRVDDLIEACALPSNGAYTAVGTYDHAEMVTMVSTLATMTNTPVPELLKGFGQHLFGRFFALYPGFFEGVTDTLDFLSRIEDVIHVEVRKLYPDAELPRFEIERQSPHVLSMVYHSERAMGDLAQGLIEAAAAHFGQSIDLIRENTDPSGKQVHFLITTHA
jgi:hypothetical protein